MRVYWSLKRVPELALLGKRDRRRVHESCFRRYWLNAPLNKRSLAAYFAMMVYIPAVTILGCALLDGLPGSGWHALIAMSAGMYSGWYCFTRVAISHLRPFYRDYIHEHVHSQSA
jgi:hypothetical protein